MVEFINEKTGTRMFVHESRVEEYKAMGHTVASSIFEVEAVEVPAPKKVERRKKKEV